MHDVLVVTMHDLVHIFQHDTEIGAGGMHLRSQLLGTAGELSDRADDSSEDAAAGLRTGRRL